MREKVKGSGTEGKVVYGRSHWSLLSRLRREAVEVLRSLGGEAIVYGSVARGDVNERSDIDIVVLDGRRPNEVEIALLGAGLEPIRKEIVMATPNSVPKGQIYLSERCMVTVPLVGLKDREEEFYKFGGAAGLPDLSLGRRVPGIDKRLMMILPTEDGHIEFSIIGREEEAAGILGISPETVRERVRVLRRRAELGRTGVFLKVELPAESDFNSVLERLAVRRPEIRRFLMKRA